jgi:hypothetical protein
MSGFVRNPTDDDERRRIELAVQAGAGMSIADFIETVIGEVPDGEFVQIVRSRLERASQNDEAFELKAEIEQLWNWRQEMA